jgi:hypothetical protein
MIERPEIEPHSQTWRRVRSEIRDAIKRHENVLRTSGTPIEATEHARGALDALEGLLKLDKTSNMHSGTKA